MAVHKVEVKRGVEPNKWKVTKYAEIGDEEFVKQMLELPTILEAGMIEGKQREDAKEALVSILIDGLMPAFSELQQIRASVGQELPEMNRRQLYEDFARKLWKSYKDLMQKAVRSMGFDIGFLFEREKEFQKGLRGFRTSNPLLRSVRKGYEEFLESNRKGWQNDLSQFRNTWVEHQQGDGRKFEKFYEPHSAELIFDCVWRTIADILPPLLEVHLPHGTRLVEQHPDDPGPRWPRRFRYQLPAAYKLE